jgi:hypothetical protein
MNTTNVFLVRFLKFRGTNLQAVRSTLMSQVLWRSVPNFLGQIIQGLANISECKTVKGNNCIFPFIFEDVTHRACTNVSSVNGATWCATQVSPGGQETEKEIRGTRLEPERERDPRCRDKYFEA